VIVIQLKDKTIVVTGGAGFIGSHLCDKLMEYFPEKLIVVDNFSLGKERNIEDLRKMENVSIQKLDASRYGLMSTLYEKENVDVTFNLAVVPLPTSLSKPKKTIDTNILITSTLCELLRRGKYETLIHISSSEAYGTAIYAKPKPMDEKHPTFPITPYAASKLACDHIALSYQKTFGLDVAIVRPFNTYGPRQNEKSYAAVIPLTICRILSGEPPIIHGDGLQTRDYSYVEDVAEAILKFYDAPSTRGRVVNIASGREISIKRLIHLIMKLMNYTGDVTHADPRPGDVRRHLGDISLARKLVGYSPKTDYETGLQKTIEWYKEQLTKTRDQA
jgi:UDP-glucose 4-epimerase